MKDVILELEKIAGELSRGDVRTAQEIRKSGQEGQAALERVFRSIHRLHCLSSDSAARLRHLAQTLKKEV
jgi:hypothetical protein